MEKRVMMQASDQQAKKRIIEQSAAGSLAQPLAQVEVAQPAGVIMAQPGIEVAQPAVAAVRPARQPRV